MPLLHQQARSRKHGSRWLGSWFPGVNTTWKTMDARQAIALLAAAGLLALSLVLLLVQQQVLGPQTCLQAATNMRPSMEFITQLQYRSRRLPDTSEGSPRLAPSNWPGGAANRAHTESSTRREYQDACGGTVYRYRVVDRVIYADHNHTADHSLVHYRNVFLEMLVMSVWLYQTFPDVTLFASFGDEPGPCSLGIPILAYTVIDSAAVVPRADGTPTMPLFVPHLLTNAPWEATAYMRGFVVPYPHSWEQLSLSQEQLATYSSCVSGRAKAAGPIPEVIWRGSNTGSYRGWRKAVPVAVQLLPAQMHAWAKAFLNKRIMACLMALDHSWLNVRLHHLDAGLLGVSNKHPMYRALSRLVVKPSVPIEQWARRPLSLSIDGHGAPWRLPQQLLSGTSAVLKMQSPYLEWFANSFQNGKHWEEFSYDLSDMATKAKQLLDGYQAGSHHLSDMAAAAQKVAVRSFGMLPQLDTFMWAVLQVKAISPWSVEKPVAGENAWQVVKLHKTATEGWSSPGVPVQIRRQIMQQQSINFAHQDTDH